VSIITQEQDVVESSKLVEIFFDVVTGSAAVRLPKVKCRGYTVTTQNGL